MISLIIPTYNEAAHLTATLNSITHSRAKRQVIVVDADSSDSTRCIAEKANHKVVFSPQRQRAFQMNLGAQYAAGGILVFLHADTVLPDSALDQIESFLVQPEIVGGGFKRRYDSTSWFLKTTCFLSGLRTQSIGWFLGDQAIFVRRQTFEDLGGFRNLDLFEDLDFSRRMAQTGRVITLSPPVICSPRRFRVRGEVLTTLSDFWLTCGYLLGADQRTLTEGHRAFFKENSRRGDPGMRKPIAKS
jgi:rSAM/selenodomain-associated transferase 2